MPARKRDRDRERGERGGKTQQINVIVRISEMPVQRLIEQHPSPLSPHPPPHLSWKASRVASSSIVSKLAEFRRLL